MGFFDFLSSSEEKQMTPQEAMEIAMINMLSFDTYRKKMPSNWKNYHYSNFSISYKKEKYNTNICIQSDVFTKDITVGKNILEDIYLIPAANGGTLISTTNDNYSEILKINEKIFSKASNYHHILSVLYNTQHKQYSKYYFTKEQYGKRVYMSSFVNVPYNILVNDGNLSPSISKRLFEYAQFALLFDGECLRFGLDTFNFTKDFLLPLISISAKCCAIADVDWGKVLDLGNADVSIDNVDTGGDISYGGNDLVFDGGFDNAGMPIDNTDSIGGDTSNKGEISFGNQQEDNEWNKKQAEHAFEQQNWNLEQAKKAADRGDISKAKDYQNTASSWGSTGKDYLNKIKNS